MVIMGFDFKSLKNKIANSSPSPSLSQTKTGGGGGGENWGSSSSIF